MFYYDHKRPIVIYRIVIHYNVKIFFSDSYAVQEEKVTPNDLATGLNFYFILRF